MSLTSLGWLALIVFITIIGVRFLILYKEDKDKRKLMVAIALFISTISYAYPALGFNQYYSHHFLYNLYHWANLPIIVSVFIMVNGTLLKVEDNDKIFRFFIIFLLCSAIVLFAQFTLTYFFQLLLTIISLEIIIVGIVNYVKQKEISSLLFVLALPCFSIAARRV